jgi:outer membrane protein assembly factor BamB
MKSMTVVRLALFSSVLMLVISSMSAETAWKSWRGPKDAGSAVAGTFPEKLNEETLKWKLALPAKGCSTPIVLEDRIYITTPDKNKDAVMCIGWDGKELWNTTIGDGRKGKHQNGSGTNPSAATDGEYLFAYFKSGNLAGLDMSGKILWQTNLVEEYGNYELYWDMGTSPVLTKKNVVVAVMHGGDSFLAAFDKPRGKLRWKVDRTFETPTEGDHSYATPNVVTSSDGKETILVWGAEHLTAHSAENGKVLWKSGGFNPKSTPNWVAVSSALVASDVAIVPYGRGDFLAGVQLGGSGDVTESHRLWTRDDTGTFVPTPGMHGDQILLLRDKGELEKIDPRTGKTTWSGELPRSSSKYYASPSVAGDQVYAAREDGVVFVARIGEEFEVLSENDLGERVIASPVPVNNRILIRGEKHLFSF